MIKTKKNNAVLFKFFQLIVILAILFLCYKQFKKLNFKEVSNINYQSIWPIVAAFLLVFLNYYFEYIKWIETLRQSATRLNIKLKIQSFFAGIITAMITPNMQGNFLGRIYYTPREKRTAIILLTIVGNLGQFITTISMGICAFYISKGFETQMWIPTSIVVTSILFYFNFNRIIFFQQKFKWFHRLAISLQTKRDFRWKILAYSFLRNLVFSLQYLLILHAFGAQLDSQTYYLIWYMYLISTLSPSLFLGKLFIRESIALWVFAPLLLPEWNIIISSLLVWVINLLLPTMVGLIICKRKISE